jgi:hypothetical protein
MSTKHLIIVAALAALAFVGSLISAPQIGVHQNRNVGVVAAFVAGSGTNTSIDVSTSNSVPFRLSEITANAPDGTATSVTVSRIWAYSRDVSHRIVSTNFFGVTETNDYWKGVETVSVTNVVYDSETNTLPSSAYFLPDEGLRIDFGTVTGVVVRLVGTAQ